MATGHAKKNLAPSQELRWHLPQLERHRQWPIRIACGPLLDASDAIELFGDAGLFESNDLKASVCERFHSRL
jgi:hypothetical protein